MSVLREAVAQAAENWLGTPYRHQASRKKQGTDCLGLIRGVWREVVGEEPVALPPYTPDWGRLGGESLLEVAGQFLVKAENHIPQRGQVILFRMISDGPVKHCGIALGSERFIHAYDGRAVCQARYSRWWSSKLSGLFDFPPSREQNR